MMLNGLTCTGPSSSKMLVVFVVVIVIITAVVIVFVTVGDTPCPLSASL